MYQNERKLMSCKEVAQELGISASFAYKIIAKLNNELETKGYLTIRGKVDSVYFRARFYPSDSKP